MPAPSPTLPLQRRYKPGADGLRLLLMSLFAGVIGLVAGLVAVVLEPRPGLASLCTAIDSSTLTDISQK